jgi:hypothetical protein
LKGLVSVKQSPTVITMDGVSRFSSNLNVIAESTKQTPQRLLILLETTLLVVSLSEEALTKMKLDGNCLAMEPKLLVKTLVEHHMTNI